MNNIEKVFKEKQAFIGFLVGGDGGLEYTIDSALNLIQAGVDILEIGLPFSDPIADGIVIQKAAERALKEGTTPFTLLEIAKGIRKKSNAPLVLFTYYNPLLKQGDSYLLKLKEAGYDGVLVVDLPPPLEGESHPYFEALEKAGLLPIFVVTPSTDEARLTQITKISKGFIYYACQKGTTGVRGSLPSDLHFHIARIREKTNLPIGIGFGIGDNISAASALSAGDGFVVGSAFVKLMENRIEGDELQNLVKKIDPRSLDTDRKKAISLDASDPLKAYRSRFSLPKDKIYFCNNSLGLPASDAISRLTTELKKWETLGVEGWFEKKTDWYTSFDRSLKKPLAHLLGAKDEEVIVMNSLTVNLHLLLVSFYSPTKDRYKILMDAPVFPSDLYAIKSQIQYHGLNVDETLLLAEAKDIEQVIEEEGESIAIVFLNPVNFLTGQLINMERLTKLAKKAGCVVGFDLAHAAGNIPLNLHDLQVDFAVGCSYKYLCSGPGGPGIAFIHSMHHSKELPRFSGWWGNDPKSRFQMHLQEEFVPYGGASSWQLSTPSIISMTPLIASMEIMHEVGINNMRKKSKLQTIFLLELLEKIEGDNFEIITPKNPEERGSQISLLIHNNAEGMLKSLENKGVICDFRPPNIIRITPSPLYNTFEEIYKFTQILAEVINE